MENNKSPGVIYYDVTRLISRRFSKFATGIDRIDIYFLIYFLDSSQYRCVPILRIKDKIIFAKSNIIKDYIKYLYSVWIEGKKRSLLYPAKLEIIGYTTNNKKFYNIRYINHILGGMARRLGLFQEKVIIKNSIYLCASHAGIAESSNSFSGFISSTNIVPVFYLHDLIPIDYPQFQVKRTTIRLTKLIKTIIDNKGYFITNSQYSANRLEHNFSTKPIGILYPYLEYDNQIEIVKGFDITSNYFVILGTIEPRKNHKLLLDIWDELVRTTDTPPKLVIIGKRGWNNENIFRILDSKNEVDNFIIEMPGLSDKQVRYIIKNSNGLLFPSFVEGFGLPAIEVQKLKVPILVSDINIFHEILPYNITKITPDDARKWKHEINKLSNKKLKVEYKEIKYNWKEELDGLIAKIIKSSSGKGLSQSVD